MKNQKSLELVHSALNQDHLEHHGIKGQQWGVKHGPPYPLSETVSREVRINRTNKGPYVKYTSKNSELIANQPDPERLEDLQIKTDLLSASEDAKLVNNRAARGKIWRKAILNRKNNSWHGAMTCPLRRIIDLNQSL